MDHIKITLADLLDLARLKYLVPDGATASIDLSRPTPDHFPPVFGTSLVHHGLEQLTSRGCVVEVLVPHSDSIDSAARVLEPPEARLLVLHADRILGRGRRDLTEVAKRAAESGDGHARSRLLSVANDELDLDEAVHPVYSRFPETSRNGVAREIRATGVDLPPIIDDPIVGPASLFIKEAVDNVRLHAVRSVDNSSLIGGHSRLTVNLFSFSADTAFDPSEIQLSGWGTGVRELMRRRFSQECEVLEICITDDGDGIPATMRESRTIYEMPLVFEVQAIDMALRSKGTRPRGRPDITPRTQKGFGFSQMLAALVSLRGVVRIRTGRSQLTWSALTSDGATLDSKEPTLSLHAWEQKEVPVVRGTSIEFCFPLSSRRPLQASSLFDDLPRE